MVGFTLRKLMPNFNRVIYMFFPITEVLGSFRVFSTISSPHIFPDIAVGRCLSLSCWGNKGTNKRNGELVRDHCPGPPVGLRCTMPLHGLPADVSLHPQLEYAAPSLQRRLYYTPETWTSQKCPLKRHVCV